MSERVSSGCVFVDTSALIALVDSTDALHVRASDVERELGFANAPLVVSEAVLTEFLGSLARPPLRAAALAAVDRITTSSRFTIVPATHRGFHEALELYRSRRDKEWSLVDCSSMLICRARGIRRVFTHDRHFAQAGFEAMLR